jgi:hypothetical protein
MDEFILDGKDLSREQLSACWRNNTQMHTYSDTPALFELLRTIRRVNLDRPAGKRLRVLLIDPPIDWDRIHTAADVRPVDFDREAHMAEVLEREVYAKGRRALFFAGGAHLSRGEGPGGLVGPLEALERRHPGTTFNIAIHEGFGLRTDELEAKLAAWPRPALARIAGTWWGALSPGMWGGGDVFVSRDGTPVKPTPDRKLQDRWDAVLLLGRRAELTRVDPPGPDVLDEAWLNELRRRQSLLGGPPGPPKPASRQQAPRDRRYFHGDGL